MSLQGFAACQRLFAVFDHPGRIACHHGIVRDVMGDDGAHANHGTVANALDAPHHSDVVSNPHIAADFERSLSPASLCADDFVFVHEMMATANHKEIDANHGVVANTEGGTA